MTVGEFIRYRRKTLHYTQKDVAQKLNIEPQTVSKWERNIGLPDVTLLTPLAELLECTTDELLNPPKITQEDAESISHFLQIVPSEPNEESQSKKRKRMKLLDFFRPQKMKKLFNHMIGMDYPWEFRQHLFKGAWKRRHAADYEATCMQGMRTASVRLDPSTPWLYLRVFGFLLLITVLCWVINFVSGFTLMVPALFFGSMAVPFTLMIFMFELNFARNVSIIEMLRISAYGGLLAILFAILFNSRWSGDQAISLALAGPIEECVKFFIVYMFVRKKKLRYISSGVLVGFAVGASFDMFETMMYGWNSYLEQVGQTGEYADACIEAIATVSARSFLAIFAGHHFWTGIVSGVLVASIGNVDASTKNTFSGNALLTLLFVIVLHTTWNLSSLANLYVTITIQIIIAIITVCVSVALINVGLAQYEAIRKLDQLLPNQSDDNPTLNSDDFTEQQDDLA